MNNFIITMKSGRAMALPAPPVAPPLIIDRISEQEFLCFNCKSRTIIELLLQGLGLKNLLYKLVITKNSF